MKVTVYCPLMTNKSLIFLIENIQRVAEETRKSKTVQLNGAVLRRNNKVREVVEPKPLWQMSKFQKQSATVQVFDRLGFCFISEYNF